MPASRTRGIERPRVIELIESAGRAQLIVVHGTAGAGKTTAIAQWARQAALAVNRVIWITLNPDDAEAASFWNRIGAALSRHGLIPLEWEPVSDAATGARLLAEALSLSPQPLDIVLDDFHHTGNPTVDDQIRALLNRVDGLRIIIGTRTLGGLQSISTAALIDTVLVDAATLAFTLDESTQLVAASEINGLADVAADLHDLTHGWPLASLALVVELEREPERLHTLGQVTDSRSTFVAELVTSALDSRSRQQRELLLRTAIADEFTVPIAAELSGQSQSVIQTALQAVESDGLGSWQVRSGVPWFRIHPLIHDELESRARAELEPHQLFELSGVLSDRLQSSRPLRALELAVAAGDWRRVEDTYFVRFGLLTNFHREASARLLFGIPRETLLSNPALIATKLVYEFGVPQAVPQSLHTNLTAANAARRNLPPREPSVASALGEVMWMGVNRLYGNHDLALSHADRATTAITTAPQADLAAHRDAVALLHVQVGATAFLTGDYPRALDALRFAVNRATGSGSGNELYQAQSLLALVNAVRGDIVEARSWVEQSEPAATAVYDGWLGRYLGTARRLALVRMHLNDWDSATADEILRSIESHADGLEYWPDMLLARARTDLLRIGPAAAHAALAASIAGFSRRSPALPMQRARMAALSSLLLWMSGQSGRAADTLVDPSLPSHPELELMHARLDAANGALPAAVGVFDTISRSPSHSPQVRVEALLGLAGAALASSHEDQAMNAFATAVATMQRFGIRYPLITVPAEQLAELIALLRGGGLPFDESVLEGVPTISTRAVQVSPLSRAERRVLAALVNTGDLTIAADALHLSEHTLRYHLKRSYRKLGVSSRSDAIARAQELGMLD